MNRPPEKKDAKAIFSAAVEYYMPEQWEGYIVNACGDDEALRQRVRELLDAHRKSDSFFDRKDGMTDGPPISERVGTTIGPYKLLQEIGEGGFGVVYMAEQQEPVRRKVALKIIKPGMDTKQIVARFEAERQALALMDHPNIAKVLDAGSTESGRPYFVMELVKGVPVTTYCDKNNLSTSERLSLFVQVCRAVQHAHQKGVIHRDIKPSNVMVTLHDGHPVPKVIDFGVSKAISQQLTEKTLFTAYGQMIGTPQYMSPEQAEMSGLDVDTRSDVYSLGVLLYELLTGTTPIDNERLRTLAYVEMQRVIREEEPPRPSARLSTMGGELTVLAKHRNTDPKHLTQLLRGDLDWIVMKAMAKERGRRYESPSTFAADIERHLADEATEARPPSTSYQLRRFARRNKGPVAAAAAVLLVLMLGIAGTTSGLITATRAKGLAQKEAIRARSAEESARQSEEAAKAAEAEARANLEKSEQLAGQLSTSVTKLSENASRLAAQRAHTLIEQDRSTEGLHWLARALELAPAGDSPLTTEIRTTMSVVARGLPSPRFVIPCAKDENFAQTTLSPDGSRLVQLIRTDPPAERRAIEARLLDAATGHLVASMAVPPTTYWVGFSGDSHGVYSFDGERLQRWSDKTGAAIGPNIDLSRYRVGESESPIPEDRLESMPPELQQRFRSLLLSRLGLQIRGITAGGKAILFAKPPLRVVPPTKGSGRGAGGSALGRGGGFYLLDLETETETLIPGQIPQLARGGELIVSQYFRPNDRQFRELRAWDAATGELREDWQVELDLQAGRNRFEVDPQGRGVLISQSDSLFQATGGSTIQFVDVTAPERNAKTLEIEGTVSDMALSPSGSWAAILVLTGGGQSRVVVWEIGSNQSRIVPLRMKRRDLGTRVLPSNFGGYEIGIGGDDKTLLIWDSEQLVGWQLAPSSQPQLALPTAGQILQLRQVGRELITVSRSAPRSGSRGNPFFAPSIFEIQRWDAANGQAIGGVIPIVANLAAISPDGRTLATSQGDKIYLWSLETMAKIGPPIDCGASVTGVEFVADGNQIAIQLVGLARPATGQNPVRITYQRIGAVMKPAPSGAGLLIERLIPGSAAEKADLRVNDIILRVGEQDISTSAEFRQQVDLESGEGLAMTVQREGVEKFVQLRPDPWPEDQLGAFIDDAGIDTVQLWDVASGQPVGQLPIPREGSGRRGGARGGPQSLVAEEPWMAIAPDGRRVVTASLFGRRTELRLFSVDTGRPIRVSVEHPLPLRWLAFGPQGRLLATLDTSSTIQLWDAEELTPLGPRIQPTSTVSAVTFAPDGRSLIVCGRVVDGPRISQWDTSTSQRLAPSIPAPNLTGLMHCSTDGQWLAAAAFDHSAWLLPLPKPWTGDAERMRQMVEATTGTTMSESGDIDSLDRDRWKSQLVQVPESAERGRRFPSDTVSPWDFNLLGFGGGLGALAAAGNDELLEQQLEVLDESLVDKPQSGQLHLRRLEILLGLQRLDDADAEFASLLQMVDRQNLIAWLKRHVDSGLGARGGFSLGGAFGGPGSGFFAGGSPGSAGSRGGRPGAAFADPKTSGWCLKKVLQLDPSDPSGLLQMINLQFQSGQTDEAKPMFARAMKTDARNLILQSLQTEAAATSSLSATLSFLRSRIRSIDDKSRAARLESIQEAMTARHEAVKHLIDWIITEQPEAWEPLMMRAELALLEQRFDDAAADLTEVAALATREQYEPALQEMGIRVASRASRSATDSNNSLERLPPRVPIWETIIDVFPDNVNALNQMILTQGRIADWEQAAVWLGRLSQTTPEEHYPRYQLAPVLLKLGRVDAYQQLCRGMLQQFDESSNPLYEGRAIQACLWHADATDDPQRLVERMQAIFDDDPSQLYYRQTALGIAHLRNGSIEEAIEWLEKAIAPDSSTIPTCEVRALAALAIAYHKSGEEAKAKEVYELATERFAEEAPEAGVEDLGSAWPDWLICDLLLEEANLQLDRSER